MSNFTRNGILIAVYGFLAMTIGLTFLSYGSVGFFLTLCLLAIATAFTYMATADVMQTRHSLLRNYPLIGRLRWIMEGERSKIQQYFVEDDIHGAPINKQRRSDIIQKSKGSLNTTPFGTMLDVYQPGYEFLAHSMYPIDVKNVKEPRVMIGKYSASVMNISAMSYGSLSKRAVAAMNIAAREGGFYQNTGEGGISEHHLQGGDLCFQIGTGYFGCGKTVDGKRFFDASAFLKNALRPQVKLIEVKLSQGAKPGHGGVLPASKNTPAIAAIRGIAPGVEVLSPPYHTAFQGPSTLLDFIYDLKRLSNKPVGIKLCLGDLEEFENLVRVMAREKRYPDFITIDGGEGGTGAAPLVFTNWVGMPLIDGLLAVVTMLKQYDIRKHVKVIASGKVTTSFDIIKLLCMGADLVNVARAFMISVGCIQARECNNNTCPVGVATQNPELEQGLDVEDKSKRAARYHHKTIEEMKDLMAALGVTSTAMLTPKHINYRGANGALLSYEKRELKPQYT